MVIFNSKAREKQVNSFSLKREKRMKKERTLQWKKRGGRSSKAAS
jgi:hypothetical protein